MQEGGDGGVVEGGGQGSWESSKLTFEPCWCFLLSYLMSGERIRN